jgi:flagellar protein FliO/FliZ
MIAALSLGTRERAVLLEVSGERILVGVTTQQIQTLHVLNQENTLIDNDKYAQFDQQLQSMIQKEQEND